MLATYIGVHKHAILRTNMHLNLLSRYVQKTCTLYPTTYKLLKITALSSPICHTSHLSSIFTHAIPLDTRAKPTHAMWRFEIELMTCVKWKVNTYFCLITRYPMTSIILHYNWGFPLDPWSILDKMVATGTVARTPRIPSTQSSQYIVISNLIVQGVGLQWLFFVHLIVSLQKK